MSAILNTYNRKKVAFTKGKGSFLYGTNGKKYLDFVQGIAVNCLGHANNYLINSISKHRIGISVFAQIWLCSKDQPQIIPLVVNACIKSRSIK